LQPFAPIAGIILFVAVRVLWARRYYGYRLLGGAVEDAQGGFDSVNAQLRMELTEHAVRADVLRILRAAKGGDAAAYDDAQKELNEHLNVLTDKSAKSGSPAALAEKIRQATAVVRADEQAYSQSALNIAALAVTNSAAAEAQFGAFNELFSTLKSDRKVLSNLIAGDMAGSRKDADTASLRARDIGIATFAAALIVVSLFAIYFYKGILNPLNQLLKAIGKVNAGAYEVRVNLRTRDELNTVGRAFDKLLDDRLATLSDAASENERLNNSVIGLFTAMGALSEKDLTIRAPVTEDIIGTRVTIPVDRCHGNGVASCDQDCRGG
jgi:HAMP domain-containing protein